MVMAVFRLHIDRELAENKPMKLYDDLADWWSLMSPPEEYAAEAGPVARARRQSR
jgi:hypothetical protein